MNCFCVLQLIVCTCANENNDRSRCSYRRDCSFTGNKNIVVDNRESLVLVSSGQGDDELSSLGSQNEQRRVTSPWSR